MNVQRDIDCENTFYSEGRGYIKVSPKSAPNPRPYLQYSHKMPQSGLRQKHHDSFTTFLHYTVLVVESNNTHIAAASDRSCSGTKHGNWRNRAGWLERWQSNCSVTHKASRIFSSFLLPVALLLFFPGVLVSVYKINNTHFANLYLPPKISNGS